MSIFCKPKEFGPNVRDFIKHRLPNTLNEVADHLGVHYVNLGVKFRKNTIKIEELAAIAEMLEQPFYLQFGDVITQNDQHKQLENQEEAIEQNAIYQKLVNSMEENQVLKDRIAKYEKKKPDQ